MCRRLSPLQSRIVWLLEEAGAEELGVLLINLHSQEPFQSWEVEDALLNLHVRKLVALRTGFEILANKDAGAVLRPRISAFLAMMNGDANAPADAEQAMEVELTPQGYAALTE